MSRLYLGNVAYSATEEEIKNLLNPFGVQEIIFVKHPDGKFKGFCFADVQHPDMAKENLNGQQFKGRALIVNDAREKTEKKQQFNR